MPRPGYNITEPYNNNSSSAGLANGTSVTQQEPPTLVAWRSKEVVSGTNRRKPTGWIPPQGYSLNSVEYRLARGTLFNESRTDPRLWARYDGCVGGFVFNSLNHFNELMDESLLVDSDLLNACLIKARGKLKQSDVNLGVAFAERNRTASLVGDTAIRIGRSFRQLRRGQVRNAMRTLGISSKAREPRGNSIPKKWLELQYGWKPLLSDVYGACNALSKRNKGDWRITVKASLKRSFLNSKTWSNTEAGFGTVGGEHRAFVRIDALPYNEALISLSSLGLTNPLSVAWEIVPYSFVVDWFIPVGNYLDGLDAALGYDAANTYTSMTSFCRATWQGYGRTYSDATRTYKNSYYEYKRAVRLERTVSNGVPLAKPPWVKDPRSLGHMANGLALLSQAFGRGR